MKIINRTNKIAIYTFLISLGALAALLWIPIYLAGPDGLEQVQYDLTGNGEYEPESNFSFDWSPFPDYEFINTDNNYGHTWLIGLIGSIITCFIIFGGFKLLLVKRQSEKKNAEIIKNV